MKAILKNLGNAALVVLGFFAVLFTMHKVSGQQAQSRVSTTDFLGIMGTGVAKADFPGGGATACESCESSASSAGSGDGGSADSGGK